MAGSSRATRSTRAGPRPTSPGWSGDPSRPRTRPAASLPMPADRSATWDPAGRRFAALGGDLPGGGDITCCWSIRAKATPRSIALEAGRCLPQPPAWLDDNRVALVTGASRTNRRRSWSTRPAERSRRDRPASAAWRRPATAASSPPRPGPASADRAALVEGLARRRRHVDRLGRGPGRLRGRDLAGPRRDRASARDRLARRGRGAEVRRPRRHGWVAPGLESAAPGPRPRVVAWLR